ncbi:MAG: transcriptional repressor [Clostridia bacterium]|nr:transcriptional repressor [Clostridia bacterium]
MTAQKMAVVNALRDAGRTHPTAETVYALAKRHLPTIALGTVYRNLSKMVESGEVVRILVPDGADRFDADISDHMHILCIGCGKIYDIEENNVKVEISNVPEDVQLIRFDVMAKCLCADCKQHGLNKK